MKKSISILLAVAILLGVATTGKTAEEPTKTDELGNEAWSGYTQITLEDYGIEVAAGENGTLYETSISGTYRGQSLNKTYLDVDINFNGVFDGTNYFHYFGSANWADNLRIRPNADGTKLSIKDWYMDKTTGMYVSRADEITFNTSEFGICADEFFNLKILTDIVVNTKDETKQDVSVRFYFNKKYAGTMAWTEEADRNHTNFYFYASSGTFSLRTPSVKPWAGYSRITMEDYGIMASVKETGTVYQAPVSGTYKGETLHKTYLDVDVNFNGTFDGKNYFHYFGSGNWNDVIRVCPKNAGAEISIYDWYMADKTHQVYEPRADEIKALNKDLGISENEFFNVKILTDIVTNPTDDTKQDVTLLFYLNQIYVGMMSWTEEADTAHNNFYVWVSSGSVSLRTPTQREKLADVTYELNGNEGYLLVGDGQLFVNEVEVRAGEVLTKPGDYVIKSVVDSKKAYIQNVTLYKVGDVNLDGADEWSSEDLMELEELLSIGGEMNATQKAADINNDGKVTRKDSDLMRHVLDGTLTQEQVVEKYHVPAVTYDFLGGDSVMPIGGFYGPYSEETINDEIYQLIADSGINLITRSALDYDHEESRKLIEKGLELGEKYGIGVFVSDSRLNRVTKDENGLVTEHQVAHELSEVTASLKEYSKYSSFLGNMVMDEPILDRGFLQIADNDYRRFKYYSQITTSLNAYANLTGYVNLLGSYHMDKNISYEEYLREVGSNMKILSFDSYPFYVKRGSSGGLAYYLQSLGTISTVAMEDGYPFWSYVQAGTDHRDDGAQGATVEYLTEAQTMWNVNTSLAFGAKGIVYFPLLQPKNYANDGSENGEYDYNRNGIIGANHEANRYYEQVKNANRQVAAVDEVLMKAENQGVVVTGKAVMDAKGISNLVTSTDKLQSVTGDDALVGCFRYQDTEAFYVVSYDYESTEEQSITLHFGDNYQYRLIQDAKTSYGEGNSCTISMSAGSGVLVVIEEHVVYYEDISEYRVETEYVVPETPAGYAFAGWYVDKECTIPLDKEQTFGEAYAKFVDANLLTVKLQTRSETTVESETTDVRFLTSADDLNYTRVGFKIRITSGYKVFERDYSGKVVYRKLSETVKPELFGYTASYIKVMEILDIPNEEFDSVFEVTPYWETLDGTIVYGISRQLQICSCLLFLVLSQ